MIAEDSMFDTSKIRERLGRQPALTHEEMLVQAHHDDKTRCDGMSRGTAVSAHGRATLMGVIGLPKRVA